MDKASALSFAEVIESLEQSFPECSSSFFIASCGQIIKVMYATEEEAAKAKEGFRKFLISEEDVHSSYATFKHWSADFNTIFPEECITYGLKLFSNEQGRLRVIMGYLISCVDYEHQVYYYCTVPDKPFVGAHAMVNPFFLWGMENNMILSHSACVGVDGSGVLLVADGGGGKSTLAVSCLMQGMDFVSDDYTMLTGLGDLRGMPIYSNIGLTPESYAMLQPPYPVHWIHEVNRNKKFMDIADEQNFCDSLAIKALVTPTVTGGETKIYEIEAQPVVMRFFRSSMKQVLGVGNQDYLFKFLNRMKGLKAYRIELGPDVIYNAEYLRDFIKRGL